MPHLPQPDLHNAIVELLTPHTRTQQDRESILTGVLAPAVLENRITWSGTAFQFATGLIDKLTGDELIAVLLQLKQIVGGEQRELIDSLIVRIRQSAAEAQGKPPPESSPATPVKLFLTHAAADAFAAQAVARLLGQAGLEVSLDLEASTHFLVLAGPSGAVAHSMERDIRYALERNARDQTFLVVPLLLGPQTTTASSLPPFLQRHPCLSLDWPNPSPEAVASVVASIRGAPPQRVNLLAPGESPFRGLLTFDASHAHLFFGRDGEVGELLGRLQSGIRFLPILGDSGSGKSSLVLAGLVPSLLRGRLGGAETDWRLATMTPGDDPLGELAKAVLQFDSGLNPEGRAAVLQAAKASLQPEEAGSSNPDALSDIFAVLPLPPASRQLLIIDQFERLFTLAPPPRKVGQQQQEEEWSKSPAARFIDIVLRGVDRPASRLHAVITFRVDFVGLCYRHQALWTRLMSDRYDLRRMDQDRLRDVIARPLALAGTPIDPHLADRLIDDVTDQPGGLALLEHALDRLWEEAQPDSPTRDHYNAIGGLKGALAKHADYVLAREIKTEPQRDLARRIFVELTALGQGTEDSARRVPKAKLEGLGPGAAEVLQIMAQQRLVVVNQDSVTVAHEALIREWETLRDWLNRRRTDVQFQRDVETEARKWEAAGRDKDLLYRGRRLDEALDWRTRNEGECLPPIGPFIEAGRMWRRNWRRSFQVVATLVFGLMFWLAWPRLESAWQYSRLSLAGRFRVNPKDGLQYVFIPPGSVPAGNSLKAIEFKTGFWMGQTEVTGEAYEKVTLKKNPSHFMGSNLPVETVNWREASEYCRAVDLKLPTEDQWEYAARAGTIEEVYGNLDDIAWTNRNSQYKTHPVGNRRPNQWALHDMLGNVWEWTNTDFDKESKVLRGGAWYNYLEYIRFSYRDRNGRRIGTSISGFGAPGNYLDPFIYCFPSTSVGPKRDPSPLGPKFFSRPYSGGPG